MNRVGFSSSRPVGRAFWAGALGAMRAVIGLATIVLVLFLLLAGANSSLVKLYYLRTDMTDFRVTSKLADAGLLREISVLSGHDFVGSDATAASIGLAPTYTVNLLSSCAVNADDSHAVCSPLRLGYVFSPDTDLQLGSTGVQGAAAQQYADALAAYGRASRYMAGAYVVAVVLLSAVVLLGSCASRRRLLVPAAVLSAVATILLLAAAVLATTTFPSVAAAINSNYGAASGLTASTGSLAPRIGYFAFALAFLSTLTLSLRACFPPRSSAARSDPSAAAGAARRPRREEADLRRQHPPLGLGRPESHIRPGGEAGRRGPRAATSPGPSLNPASHDGDDWAHEDEYTAGGQEAGIAMHNLAGANKRTHDVNTAYEPFTNTG